MKTRFLILGLILFSASLFGQTLGDRDTTNDGTIYEYKVLGGVNYWAKVGTVSVAEGSNTATSVPATNPFGGEPTTQAALDSAKAGIDANAADIVTLQGNSHADDDVESVTGTGVDVTDPRNPIINAFDPTALQTQITENKDSATSQDVRISALEAKPDLVDDADNDPVNEIQAVTSADGSVTITPSGNDFDLSVPVSLVDSTRLDEATNELVSYQDGVEVARQLVQGGLPTDTTGLAAAGENAVWIPNTRGDSLLIGESGLPAYEHGEFVSTTATINLPAGTNSSTAVTCMTFTIPSAGTWRITPTIRGVTTNLGQITNISSGIQFGLYNSTGTLQADSETLTNYLVASGTSAIPTSFSIQSTGTTSFTVTTTGSETYTIRAWNTGSGSASVQSNDSGRSKVRWEKVAGFVPISSTKSQVFARKNTAQSIVSATDVVVTNWVEEIDTKGEFDPATGVFTASESGVYNIDAQLIFESVVAPIGTQFQTRIRANGIFKGINLVNSQEGTIPLFRSIPVHAKVSLNAGEKIEVIALHGLASTINLHSDISFNYISITQQFN